MEEDQLASAGQEGLEVGIGGVHRPGRLLAGKAQSVVQLWGLVIPIGGAVDHVAEVSDDESRAYALARLGAGNPRRPATHSGFASGQISREDGVAGGVTGSGIDEAELLDLGRGEARVGIRRLAEQDSGIEMALAGVVEHPIGDSVVRVAGGDNGIPDGRDFGWRDEGVFIRGLKEAEAAGEHRGPVVGGRSGEDAIVILGITLGFHQRLAASVRASREIGPFQRLAVERLHDALGIHCHLVNAAIAVVGNFFEMIQRPGCVRAGVTCIGTGGGVALADGRGEIGVVDITGETTVALPLELAFPAALRQPDLDLDL